MKVWVFVGHFESEAQALAYTQEQWEPEPGEEVSDQEYAAWEDNNPRWQFRDDLPDEPCIDSDFVETAFGVEWPGYLAGLIPARDDRLEAVIAAGDEESNCLLLVFEEALGGFPATLTSTPALRLIGQYEAVWD